VEITITKLQVSSTGSNKRGLWKQK